MTFLRFLVVFFWHGFVFGFSKRVLLVLILVVMGSVVFLNLGAAEGLPILFWHENPWKQGLAGWSVAVLVFVTLFVGFLLDTKSPEQRAKWLAALPEHSRRDLIGELKYYLVGGVVSLAVIGGLAAGVWRIGTMLQARHLAESNVTSAAQTGEAKNLSDEGALLLKDPTELRLPIPFWTGALLAGVILYFVGKRLAPAMRTGRLRSAFKKRGTTPSAAGDAPPTPPDPEVLKKRVRLLAGIVFTALALNYVVNFTGLGFATPATALCSAMGLVAMAYGYMTYWDWNRTAVITAVVLLMMVGGIPRYKVQIPGLAYYYVNEPGRQPTSYPSQRAGTPAKAPGDLIETTDVAWAAEGGQKRPLVLVCVSGGGMRASVWSASVLCELERRMPDFPYHVRMISGASGGMVGAGYYVSSLRAPPKGTAITDARASHVVGQARGDADALETLVRNLARDSLSVPVKRMIFHDALWTMFPWANREDRGTALEGQWERYWDAYVPRSSAVGGTTFGDLWAGEKAGWRPSLVYTPMLVEDGRRLIISNMDLDALTVDVGPRLQEGWERAYAEEPVGFYSRSSAQFALLFPVAWPGFKVVTAARLSASFPYVSPAAVLPTSPRRRVVDAGYYDNYGVTVAAGWLASCLTDPSKRAWLHQNVSAVLVLQVRDGVNRLGDRDTAMAGSKSSAGGRGFEWLDSPVEGVLAARDSVSLFRNDASLQKVGELFRGLPAAETAAFGPGFFETATVEFDGDAPLSWYLTREEATGLMETASMAPAGGRARSRAAEEMVRVRAWFEDRKAAPGVKK